jgi:hypothetical protein
MAEQSGRISSDAAPAGAAAFMIELARENARLVVNWACLFPQVTFTLPDTRLSAEKRVA